MRSVAVQSIVFNNPVDALHRAALAVAESCRQAVANDRVSGWRYVVGDCSPKPVFSTEDQARFAQLISAAGGVFEYEFFNANLGSAAGHNRLANCHDDELIVILNPDAMIAPLAIGHLATALETPGVGSAEARQVPLEHPKEYNPHTFDTEWSSTACLMTVRTAFNAVGGFDSDTFFLYCDDVDYSWQLRLHGFRVLYLPWATVFHDKRLSIRGEWLASEAEVYHSALAAILLAHKYSRKRLASKLSRNFAASPNTHLQAAAEEFERRKRDSELCTPVDARHRVARFTDGKYTTHRF